MTKYKKTTCLKKLIEVEGPTLVLVEHPEQALSQKSVLQCSMAMVMVMLMVMMAPVHYGASKELGKSRFAKSAQK